MAIQDGADAALKSALEVRAFVTTLNTYSQVAFRTRAAVGLSNRVVE